jgi:hypothetical protein
VKLNSIKILLLSLIVYSCSLTPSSNISRSPQSISSNCTTIIEYFIPSIGEIRLKIKLDNFIGKKIKTHENIFSDNELYQILSEHPGAAKKTLQYMDQTLKPQLLEQLINDYPRYWPLLAHPGVANNKEKFLHFVDNNDYRLKNLNFNEILLKFEIEFEKVKVFRGVSLTKEELQLVKIKGLRAPIYLYADKYRKQMLENMLFLEEYTSLKTLQYGGLRKQVEKRIHVNPTYTQSVTEYFEIAATVGHLYKIKKEGEVNTYVFEINIPALYLVGGRFSLMNDLFRNEHFTSPFINAGNFISEGKTHFKVGGKIFPLNIESFIFDDIEARFIVNTIAPSEELLKTRYEFVDGPVN